MSRIHFLGVQVLGVAATALWATVAITILFALIKRTIGLRVSPEEELGGLDLPEHGLVSAYADFAPSLGAVNAAMTAAPVPAEVAAGIDEAVPVQLATARERPMASDVKLSKVTILCKQERLAALEKAMTDIGITGMTVSNVLGCGVQKGKTEYYRGSEMEINLLPKIQVEIVVAKVPVRTVIDAAKKVLYTGHIGDGKIFVYDVENVVKMRTGEEGCAALQDIEQC